MSTRDALRETGTIAILRGRPYEQAAPLVQALYAGGIRLAEVTVDSPDAFEMITKLRKIWDGKLYIGAGTITDEDRCARALEAGAQFVVRERLDRGVDGLDLFEIGFDLFAVLVGFRTEKGFDYACKNIHKVVVVSELRILNPTKIVIIF